MGWVLAWALFETRPPGYRRAVLPGILKFRPFVRPMPWGGEALARLFGKPCPSKAKIGETWEIADRPEGASVVAEGPLAGKTLTEIYHAEPGAFVGGKNPPGRFPLLVKFIDAADWLSLQVHPDAAAAEKLSAEPKTECWVILEAAPGAFLYLGLSAGKTPQDLESALAAGRPETVLAKRPVAAGDAVFVPAGTVHAIGPGIVLAEIQQNSDTTWRLSDWGRAGPDGKPRPLHLAEGLASVRNDPRAGKLPQGRQKELPGARIISIVACDEFSLERLGLTFPFSTTLGGNALCLGVLSGRGTVTGAGQTLAFFPGDWFLVPKTCRAFAVKPQGPATLLSAQPAG